MNKRRLKRWVNFLLAIFLLLLFWQLASLVVQKDLLPSPFIVLKNLPLLFSKGIIKHLQASFLRVLMGMICAVLLGFGIGLMIGRMAKWRELFDPLLYLTYPIPKMALLPIVMLLGGLGDLSKILMIVLIVAPQVAVAVRDGVRDIPEYYYDVYRCIGASNLQQFFKITVPASLPAIFGAVRISLGTALSILFFTENYGTEYGMGYFIMDSWTRLDYPAMYGGILILSCLGLILFLLLDQCAAYILKWRKNQ
ncbi:ABC transporter permease [Enterococcus mediterraneensis]|uniref:ABC transporter permease n=1 Tax=Enterococcus mediterraneensis TaxID=2364791 RepID=UPI000F048A63|nr:ABC transporter permease [Enterococcus mediterraneensis]